MALLQTIRDNIEKQMTAYCERRVPPHARDQVRVSYGIRGNSVTLFEERPSYVDPSQWTKLPIAQFRCTEDGEWTLYCADRNDRWHEYFDAEPSHDLQDLLDEVDADPTGIFWG